MPQLFVLELSGLFAIMTLLRDLVLEVAKLKNIDVIAFDEN